MAFRIRSKAVLVCSEKKLFTLFRTVAVWCTEWRERPANVFYTTSDTRRVTTYRYIAHVQNWVPCIIFYVHNIFQLISCQNV